MKPLSNDRHDAVRDSAVGQFIDRLIREEAERGGNTSVPGMKGTVIQALWYEFTRPIPTQ